MNTNPITQLDLVLLEAYRAPRHERAVVKGVPISELDTVRNIFRQIGTPFRIRFRGPRHDGMRLTTLKRHATAFSVYTV